MLKRMLLLSMALLIAVGTVWASDIVYLEPTKVTDKAERSSELDEFFYLTRFGDATAEYYLGSGDLGDTMAVHFQPLAPCSVYFAETQWFSAGNFQSFMWEYSDEAADMYPDGRAPARGTSPVSPLGDLMFGPYNNSCEASQDWEPMFTSDDLPGGGVWIDDGRNFMVGFVKTGEGGEPHPLADDISARGFSYTWFGGPWMDDFDYPWGGYSPTVVDIMMRVGVTYPEGAPPIIGSMNQLPNTINGSKTVSVSSEIVDDNGWTTDEAWLMVQKNEEEPMAYEMLDPEGDDIFSAEFTIDGAPGDTYAYWIEATDDEGQTNSIEDNQLSFQVVELGAPTADILVIDHGSRYAAQMDEALTWYYQWWDVTANKGIDEFTLDNNGNGWGAVFVIGWGSSSMPTRAWENSAYYDYATGGGHMFFADQDYFYANGEPEEPTFAAGDLAYDVFGIQGGLNDVQPTDSVFYGEPDDPISGSFFDEAFELNFGENPDYNWTDGVISVAGANDIFFGQDVGNINGIRYENDYGGKTAYLAFDIEYALDWTDPENPVMTDQWVTLMDNVLNWFGANAVGEGEVAQPLSFSLAQNYPNPFNPATQIAFTLPHRANVMLSVFNVNGREVATLVDAPMNAGQQMVTFDASSLASGIYFYKLQADEFAATRKMMLLK